MIETGNKLLLVGALPESLINFRGELIKAMVAAGHSVVAMSAPADEEVVSRIEALGAKHRSYPVQRNGLSPWQDLASFAALYRAVKQEQPDVILAYTIKSVIWGGLATRFSGRKAQFHALITGLGYTFQQAGFKRWLLGALVKWLYRLALRRAAMVFFQNPDNCEAFVGANIVRRDRCRLVNGSGVDVARFGVAPLPQGELVFLCIARLLGEKGLREYAAAAELVKQKYPDAAFRLVGPPDPSPDGIAAREVEQWQAAGIIDYRGEAADVRPFLRDCHVYVLPSYHEGLPRTVIEAMATGRAIVTTDAPGCRETVTDGDNGYLVPVRDVARLAEGMCRFIEQPALIEKMGRRSRQIAEEKFDVYKINQIMLREMGLLPGGSAAVAADTHTAR